MMSGFNPSQPRNSDGEWSKTGAGGGRKKSVGTLIGPKTGLAHANSALAANRAKQAELIARLGGPKAAAKAVASVKKKPRRK